MTGPAASTSRRPRRGRNDRHDAGVLKVAAVAAAAALAASAAASGATPASLLAGRLRSTLQAYYRKADPGLRITVVTCRIARDGKTARCSARFSLPRARAVGVFVIAAAIDRASGRVATKTLSASCKDGKTGAKMRCF